MAFVMVLSWSRAPLSRRRDDAEFFSGGGAASLDGCHLLIAATQQKLILATAKHLSA